jgi:hypothetical protein
VGHQHDIVAVGREDAERPIGDGHVRHRHAAPQTEILDAKIFHAGVAFFRNGALSCCHGLPRSGVPQPRLQAASDLGFHF